MAEVDPRFDPQFQRGYDPARHGRASRRPEPPLVEERAEQPLVEERAEGTRLETRPEQAVVSTGSTSDADADLDPPRRNPFRLILLLASLAAIAGAALLLWRRIATDPYGGYGGYGGDTAQVFVQQFTDALLAPLLTGGLLGLCLWLALGALRRQPRP